MNKKPIKIAAAAAAALLTAAAVTFVLFYTGVLKLNDPSREKYPVRGVDVSHYQGKIDWEKIRAQNIDFAYIKATEGSSHVDERFAENLSGARDAGLRVGAYHFFSFDSPAETQAKNLISTAPAYDGMLPPAVDVELYGKYKSSPPDGVAVRRELRRLLAAIEDEYGIPPVIYATDESYKLYISGDFEGYDIWIRDIFSAPSLPDGREWTFWQFTNRGRLQGFDGDEPYIDVNVFFSGEEEFKSYGAVKE